MGLTTLTLFMTHQGAEVRPDARRNRTEGGGQGREEDPREDFWARENGGPLSDSIPIGVVFSSRKSLSLGTVAYFVVT